MPVFDAPAFLDSVGVARVLVTYRAREAIFTQGDPGAHVMYIQAGSVTLSVRSKAGREAVVATLGAGDFFGEGCLAGQQVRTRSATAAAPSAILFVEKQQMARLLHGEHTIADRFISHMLSRNIRIEEDLIDQLITSSEKRLARMLLQLARYGTEDKPVRLVPQNPPADARRHDRHLARAREFFPEQVQEARLHRVRQAGTPSRSTTRCSASSCTTERKT